MGYGDELMATGIAKIVKRKFPDRQIVIGNFKKKIVTRSIIFLNNPNIINDPKEIDQKKIVHFVNSSPGNRPHINWKKTVKGKRVWNFNFKPTPGELFFSMDEVNLAKKAIQDSEILPRKAINTNIMGTFNIVDLSNKYNVKKIITTRK